LDDHTRARELFDAILAALASEGYKCTSSMAKHLVADCAIKALYDGIPADKVSSKIDDVFYDLENGLSARTNKRFEQAAKELAVMLKAQKMVFDVFDGFLGSANGSRLMIEAELSDFVANHLGVLVHSSDFDPVVTIAQDALVLLENQQHDLPRSSAGRLAAQILLVIT
jgi:hypothetical protein